MSSTNRIVIDKEYNCKNAGAKIHFVVTEVSTHPAEGGLPATIAQVPNCSGWPFCEEFSVEGFPPEWASTSPPAITGCPFFDSRITGGI